VHNETGYCDLHGEVRGFWDVIYPKLQHNTSSCAGSRMHSNDPSILQECGAISDDALNYYVAMEEIADY